MDELYALQARLKASIEAGRIPTGLTMSHGMWMLIVEEAKVDGSTFAGSEELGLSFDGVKVYLRDGAIGIDIAYEAQPPL